jgi:predicted DNA-binding protein YlxM (UPF0122 family)
MNTSKRVEQARQRLKLSGIEGLGLTEVQVRRVRQFVGEDLSFAEIARREKVEPSAVSVSIYGAARRAVGHLMKSNETWSRSLIDSGVVEFAQQLKKP